MVYWSLMDGLLHLVQLGRTGPPLTFFIVPITVTILSYNDPLLQVLRAHSKGLRHYSKLLHSITNKVQRLANTKQNFHLCQGLKAGAKHVVLYNDAITHTTCAKPRMQDVQGVSKRSQNPA